MLNISSEHFLTCRLATYRFVSSQVAGLLARISQRAVWQTPNSLARNMIHSQLVGLQLTTHWLALGN